MANFQIGRIKLSQVFIFFIVSIVILSSKISALPQQPQISINPSQADFGEVKPGTLGPLGISLFIINSGNDTLKIYSIGQVLNNEYLYVTPTYDTLNILSQDSIEIMAGFVVPEITGDYIDSILITSNDPDNPDTTLPMMARVVDADIDLSISSPYDFGDVVVGDSGSYKFYILNRGNLSLEVYNITTLEPAFSVSDTSMTIDTVSLAPVTIKFKPTEVRDYVDTLRIYSNDSDEGIVEVVFLGRGVIPVLSTYSTTVQFGEVSLRDSLSVKLPVYNSGNAVLNITNVTGITGDDTLFFSLSDTSESINPGDSSNITVKFTPGEEKTYDDVIYVESAGVGTVAIELQGRGVRPELTFIPEDIGESIAFGDVKVNETSTINLNIWNTGTTGNLEIWNINYDSTQIFSIDTTSKSIAPDGIIVIPIVFTPKARIHYIDYLSFVTNDTGKLNVSIPLTGTGIAPFAVFSPSDSCNFDSTIVQNTSVCTLYVSNSGNANLNITNVTYPFGMESIFDIGISPGHTIEVGLTDTFFVNFTPDEGKIFTDSFAVWTDDPDNEKRTLILYGVGKAPEISVNARSYDFGDTVMVGDFSSWDLKIYNSGTDTLRVDSIIVVNRLMLPDEVFEVSFSSTVLDVDDSLSVEVKYLPEEDRRYLDTLKIYSSANKEPIVPVVLTANLTKNYFPLITSVPETSVLDTLYVNEDTIYKYRIIAEDFDVEPLKLTIQNSPPGLSVDTIGYINSEMNWEINWTPDQINVGVNQIFIIAEDSKAAADTQVFYIKVSNVNDAPVIITIPDTTAFVDSLFTIQIEATDQENDSLTYLLLVFPVSSYGKMTVSDTGLIQWRPDINFNESYTTVTVKVSDGIGGVTYVSFKINISIFNNPPEVIYRIPDIFILEDCSTKVITDLDTIFFDVNSGTILEYSVVSDTSGLEVSLSEDNEVSITPQKDYFGISYIILGASDKVYTVYDTITIEVLPLNDPPFIISVPDTTAVEDSLYTYKVQAEDVDEDSLRFLLDIYPSGMTIDSTGLINWLPDNNDVGDTVVMVTVYDDSAASDSQVFNLRVIGVNNAPVLSSIPDIIIFEDSSDSTLNLYDYVSDVDNDKDELRFEVSYYKNVNVVINDKVEIIPPADWSGVDTLIFTAFDPSGAYSTDTVVVTVIPVNDSPKIVNLGNFTFNEDDSLTIYLNQFAYDIDDSITELKWEIYGGENISFLLSDSSVIFRSVLDWNGKEDFTFILTDTAGLKDSTVIDISVRDINDPPVIVFEDTTFVINEDDTIKVSYKDWAYDADNDEINWEFRESENIKIRVDNINKDVVFVPIKDFFGKDSIKVIAFDSRGGIDSGMVIFDIININDPPVIVSIAPDEDTVFVKKGGYVKFEFTAYDPDEDDLNIFWSLDDNIIPYYTGKDTFLYVAGEKLETKSLRVIVSDGKKEVFNNWIIMSGWEVSLVLESFYAVDSKESGIKIIWEILKNDGSTGFNILRSEDENGKFEKINDRFIYDNGEKQFIYYDNRKLTAGEKYYYKLENINISGVKSLHGPISVILSQPERWNLSQNFPNPFNTETIINFSLPKRSNINISIYNINGMLIRTLTDMVYDSGYYCVKWDGKNYSGFLVSSGIYFCTFKSKDTLITRKVIFAK